MKTIKKMIEVTEFENGDILLSSNQDCYFVLVKGSAKHFIQDRVYQYSKNDMMEVYGYSI